MVMLMLMYYKKLAEWLSKSPEEEYLSKSVDISDFESRLQKLQYKNSFF